MGHSALWTRQVDYSGRDGALALGRERVGGKVRLGRGFGAGDAALDLVALDGAVSAAVNAANAVVAHHQVFFRPQFEGAGAMVLVGERISVFRQVRFAEQLAVDEDVAAPQMDPFSGHANDALEGQFRFAVVNQHDVAASQGSDMGAA